MYRHGLMSLLMVASVVSLNVKSNDPGTPPPHILVDNDARIERSSIYDEFAEGLYQGDIMLTEEQKWRLLNRKVIANSAQWWPRTASGGVDVNFRYADATINQIGVQVAIDRWQAATCVRFHKILADVTSHHLIFTHSETSCNSFVGQTSTPAGQVINLTPSCINGVGSAIHEIGHAMGLFHEQSRSDRDDHVYIISDNIDPVFSNNFLKEVDNNFSVPYDYSSVMHYPGDGFSLNGSNTIVTKDFAAQLLIGQRADFSFMDIRIVNLQYKCIDDWLRACGKTTDPCQNFGFTKADCTCSCPAGTSGVNCETLIQPYIDALKAAKSPNNLKVTTETIITSPLFPAAIQTELAYVQVITAPPCYTVKLTFNAFDFHPKSEFTDGKFRCYFMSLEIRTSDPPIAGTKYCGTSIVSGDIFQSAGRTMVLFFTSHPNTQSFFTGYNAAVQFVRTDPTCVTSASTTTPTVTSASTTTPATTTPTTTTPTTTTPITTTPTTTTHTTTPTTTTPTVTSASTTTPTVTSASTTTPATTTPTTTTHTTTTPTTTTPTTTTPTTTTPTTTTPTTKTPTTKTPTTTTPTTTRPTTPTPTTTPSTRPGCRVTNSGNVPLLASLSGTCRLSKVNAATYNLVSPNYPSRYGRSAACKGWFSTDEPRYVRVTPVAVNIGTSDRLSFTQVYRNKTRVTNAVMGGHLVFPTSSAHMSFSAGHKKPGHKFSFNMEVVNSKCHQIIIITPGVTCSLSVPTNYPRGTICEWWIKAPPGKKVRVTFTRFNIGNKKCLEDFLAIDTRGNNRYSRATRYCGNNKQSPGTVTSTGNQINILLNGRDGHFGGFDATYTVV